MRFSTSNVVALLFLGASSVTAITCGPGSHVVINANNGLPVCRQCPKGTYSSGTTSGTLATTCTECAPGTFNNVAGATGCCTCCQGSYQPAAGANNCLNCKQSDGGAFSIAGATSSSDCGSFVPGSTGNTATCRMDGDQCPPTQQNAPAGSVLKRKRDLGCARGFKKCQRMSGLAGFDCVDVANDPESCGDCVAPFSSEPAPGYTGQDCTAIPGVSVVNCKRGGCQIVTCRKGFVKSSDGKECQPEVITFQKRSIL